MVGTIDGQTGVITMTEIGPHPKSGFRALISARLVAANQMAWEYVGLADDDAMGKVFITGLDRGPSAPERASCPDITGTWSSPLFDSLKVSADGSRMTSAPTSTKLEVVYQAGCQFQAVNRWSSGKLGVQSRWPAPSAANRA